MTSLRCCSARATAQGLRRELSLIASALQRCRRCQAKICFSTRPQVRVGMVCGLEERSFSPAFPWGSNRLTKVCTHLWEMPIASAMWALAHPA